MSEESFDLDQTLYLASRIYHSDDSPIPLDIHSACAIGNYKSVRDWIDEGIDFNQRNKAGWTPLMYASYVGHDTVVNLLLDSGAEASKGTPTGLTPLMVASGCGNESVCYFLIQNGAYLDPQDENGYTALVHAVRQGHQTAVQLLLETGADMELVDKENGYTALMFAAIEGDEIIADILVACGADIGANDKDNHNARFLAFKGHNVRIVTLLDNAMYMYRPMSETPTNTNVIIEEPLEYNGEDSNGEGKEDEEEDHGDLYSGAKEMEAYQESMAIKKSIQYNLGRRSGPRWSLPHQYIGDRHLSESEPNMFDVKHRRKHLRPAMSMPERANPPAAALSPEPSPVDSKMVMFLSDLGLEKYISILQEQEIDYDTLTNFNEEDLKRVGIKLMGPRKKLTLAITELREQKDKEMSTGKKSSISSHDDKGGSLKRNSRPKLMKQSSTDVAEAYRGALETIFQLEEKVAQEHHLRKTADSFLLELQTTRRQAITSVVQLTDTQKDIAKHCGSVKSTHVKLSDELDNLRVLSSSSIDSHELQVLYTEVISLNSKMNMELEALSRSIELVTELTNTLSFQLKANS